MKITLIFKQIPGSNTWLFYIWLSLYYLPSDYSNFFNVWHKKLVRLSALRTGRLYHQEILLALISVRAWVDPRGHSAVWRIKSMKNSSETIGNRTRDLLACSAVPKPTAPPRIPPSAKTDLKKYVNEDNIKTRQAIYILRNNEARLCNYCCRGKAISITHSECVFLALVIQHAMRMSDIAVCDLAGCIIFFHIRHDFQNIKYIWFSLHLLSETSLIVIRIQRAVTNKWTLIFM